MLVPIPPPPPLYVIHPQEDRHTHTVIFLHGRDSLADEFASEIVESEGSPLLTTYASFVALGASFAAPTTTSYSRLNLLELLPTVRWVFPFAPSLHSTRFDTQMSQWFDMWSVENPSEKNELQIPGLKHSISRIHEVIRREAAIVEGGRKNIFLAGISQGFAAVMASYLAAAGGVGGGGGFAGIIGLSGWLPFVERVEEQLVIISEPTTTTPRTRHRAALVARQISQIYRFGGDGLGDSGYDDDEEGDEVKDFRPTPIFLGHCADDEVVPKENGERMMKVLDGIVSRCGGSVQWHVYKEGGHWLNEPQGVDDIVKFIRLNMHER